MYQNLVKQEPPYEDATIRQSELGQQLRYIREEVGITIKELAELTGLSTKTIWKLETGRNVELGGFIRVLESLHYELNFLEIDAKHFGMHPDDEDFEIF